MRIFVDANILVSVLNKEYPLYSSTARILSLTTNRRFRVFTSPLSLGIAFYFAEKKNKNTAKDKLNLLIDNLNITTINESIVLQTKNNKAIHDFEDGLEYYLAIHSKCDCIITEDTDDFYFSDIPVYNAVNFIEKIIIDFKKLK